MRRPSNRPQDALTRTQIDDLLKTFDPRWPTARRNLAIVLCMLDCGLRSGEVRALELTDIIRESGQIVGLHVRPFKASPARRAWATPRLAAVLARWIAYIQDRSIPGPLLFPTIWPGPARGPLATRPFEPGRPLNRAYLYAMTRRHATRAGIAGRCSPHTLRHTFATHALRTGATLEHVRRALGHRKITTTSTFYAHLVDDDLRIIAHNITRSDP